MVKSIGQMLLRAAESWYDLIKQAGRIEEAEKRYPNIDVREVAKHDPSGTNKYLMWMAREVLRNLSQGQYADTVYSAIKAYHANIHRLPIRDINKIENLEELNKMLANLKISNRKQQAFVKGSAPVIFENDSYVVIRPDTKEAVILYGKNTQWCITSENETHYESYRASNIVFYFVFRKHPKGDALDKIAISILRNNETNEVVGVEYHDANDRSHHELPVPEEYRDAIISEVMLDVDRLPVTPEMFIKKLDRKLTAEEMAYYSKLHVELKWQEKLISYAPDGWFENLPLKEFTKWYENTSAYGRGLLMKKAPQSFMAEHMSDPGSDVYEIAERIDPIYWKKLLEQSPYVEPVLRRRIKYPVESDALIDFLYTSAESVFLTCLIRKLNVTGLQKLLARCKSGSERDKALMHHLAFDVNDECAPLLVNSSDETVLALLAWRHPELYDQVKDRIHDPQLQDMAKKPLKRTEFDPNI